MQIIQCEEKSKQIAFDTEVKYISIYTLVQDKTIFVCLTGHIYAQI